MPVTLPLAGEHGTHLECAPIHIFFNIVRNLTKDWGLVVRAADLTVPRIWVNVWSGGTLVMGYQRLLSHTSKCKPNKCMQIQREHCILSIHHGMASVLVC
jgi:hypothetical protein